ncbi:DMT family transporter [Paenibacillus sp. KQZ6P-2]|uniref:DMT family transporter n=1 Tax=Paenibacillus mangrovi TaxID=2931978 RepID=A0A9X1WQS0_9BACL|nr:DMT family transporter [Paenibacillus mangrovi]MCJ8011953.1 DMT family transporter [Paenibacillus mangrovi]
MKKNSYLLLIGISLIWGSQFFLVNLVIGSIPPVTLAAAKALIGAATLALLHVFSGKRTQHSETKPPWRSFLWIGLLEAVVPFILIGWGQQTVSSSMASILMGTIPIFTILFVKLFVPGETISGAQWLSAIIGMVGIGILFVPDLGSSLHGGSMAGDLALLGASVSFAGSLILIKRLPPIAPILAMRNVLFAASVILVPLALLLEDPFHVVLTRQQILAVVILGSFHAGIVYMLYNVLIQRAGATFASFNNYLVPPIGIILGVSVLGDELTWNAAVGLVVILLSLAVGGIQKQKRP